MKGVSVPTHVTDWNDAADEESAPKGEQKGALPRTPPKGAALWNPAKGAQAPLESRNHERFSLVNLLFFAAIWMQIRGSKA